MAIWDVAKALQIPLDKRVKTLPDIPYTISFVIRKRQQIDNLMELEKKKRPPDSMIWDGTPEELDEWIDTVVLSNKKDDNTDMVIDVDSIEG